jgi:hypothetical protein
MKAFAAAVVVGALAWSVTPAAAAPPVVRSLPWPPSVLPRTPPLAPATSGVLPVSPLLLGRLETRERIVVGIDKAGKPHSVRVLQRIVIKRLGDYVFAVPAPVRSVTPAPGTESVPGQRENQILWEGFSPGRRVLAAWADLRVGESAHSLPLRVRLETTVDGAKLAAGERRSGELRAALTITNATRVEAQSYTAEPELESLAVVADRIRAAIRRDVFAEGLNVGFFGGVKEVKQRVAAPLRVEGTLRFGSGTVTIPGARDGVVRFSARLDGLKRAELRVELHGRAVDAAPPRLELRARTADLDDPVEPPGGKSWTSALARHELGDPRRLLARTIALELNYARTRQYDMFLAAPDLSGPASSTYVFRSSAPTRATPAAAASGGEDHTVGWIALAVVLAAAVPAAAVMWAHS